MFRAVCILAAAAACAGLAAAQGLSGCWIRDVASAGGAVVLLCREGILISRDGGESRRAAPLRVSEAFTRVMAENGRLWTVSPHNVFASQDGGETWLARHPFAPGAAGS